MPESYLTTKELAAYLKYSYGTIRNVLSDETRDGIQPENSSLPPFYWIKNHRRWKPSVVDEWVMSRTGK